MGNFLVFWDSLGGFPYSCLFFKMVPVYWESLRVLLVLWAPTELSFNLGLCPQGVCFSVAGTPGHSASALLRQSCSLSNFGISSRLLLRITEDVVIVSGYKGSVPRSPCSRSFHTPTPWESRQRPSAFSTLNTTAQDPMRLPSGSLDFALGRGFSPACTPHCTPCQKQESSERFIVCLKMAFKLFVLTRSHSRKHILCLDNSAYIVHICVKETKISPNYSYLYYLWMYSGIF